MSKRKITILAERADPRDKGFQCVKGSSYYHFMIRRYAFCLPLIEHKIVLDIPCGVGWGTSTLWGYKKIYAIDICKEALIYGHSQFNPNIKLITGDMAQIPLKANSIDCVLCLDGYEHISLEKQYIFIDEVVRILKLKGTLVLITPPYFAANPFNPYHTHEAKYEEIMDALLNKITIIYEQVIDKNIDPNLFLIGERK